MNPHTSLDASRIAMFRGMWVYLGPPVFVDDLHDVFSGNERALEENTLEVSACHFFH